MEGKRSLQVKRVSESNLKEDLEMHATLRQLTDRLIRRSLGAKIH